MNIDWVEIGQGHPCRFVAEVANAHNGSLDRALRLIDAAKEAGADFLKTQCYTADELVALRGDGPAPEPWGAQGWTMRALYEKAATPFEWFPAIRERCAQNGIVWFSSVFGAESLALLESLGCPAYKIARLDNKAVALVDAVAMTGKPFLASSDGKEPVRYTAYPHPDPIYKAKAIASANGGGVWCISVAEGRELYCPPGYPQVSFGFLRGAAGTDYDDCGTDGTFGENHLGFSFHGTDPTPCIVAATLGAKMIEAHFQLDDEPSELEANVSLTASQFRRMVDDVRRVEAMLA